MFLTDGECPRCEQSSLYLNTSDLFECPRCSFVCTCIDGLVATVMPYMGEGRFRFEDCRVLRLDGIAFAPSAAGGAVPDVTRIFWSRDELIGYLSNLPASKITNSKGLALSQRFFEAFRRGILESPASGLQKAARSKAERTRFYADYLLPKIAADLGLAHIREEFKVDHVAATYSANEHAVPKIFVESENDFAGAIHEIRKLCSLNSPLRVLITFTAKQFTPEPATGAFRELRSWQAVIRSHYELDEDFRGTIAVVVAYESHGELVFQACAFHSNSDLSWPLSKLVSRDIR